MILRWLPRAIKDLDAQIDYIAEHDPRAAIQQGDKIESMLNLLLDDPEMGRTGRMNGTRELVISGTPFIMVYRCKPHSGRIEVIRLLHGAQQWPTKDS